MHVRYRLDDSLFNLRRLLALINTQKKLIWDHIFADDTVLFADTNHVLQRIIFCFEDASWLFCLKVGLRKTEILHQPMPEKNTDSPTTPLAMLNRIQHNNSLILAASSHWTKGSSKKSTTDSERQVVYFVECPIRIRTKNA